MNAEGFRRVTICAGDIEDLETAGQALLRLSRHSPDACSEGLRILAIALRLRGQSGFRAADQVFACDVDESGGLAEVVELRGYLRCVK